MRRQTLVKLIGLGAASVAVIAFLIIAFLPKTSTQSVGASPGWTVSGPCSVRISKAADKLSLSLRNDSHGPVILQKHGELWGYMRFLVVDSKGKWVRLRRVDPGFDADYPDPSERDWVCLDQGERISWPLEQNIAGRLAVGQEVKVEWEQFGQMPKGLAGIGELYPGKSRKFTATVSGTTF
jgi:hypothetical protein